MSEFPIKIIVKVKKQSFRMDDPILFEMTVYNGSTKPLMRGTPPEYQLRPPLVSRNGIFFFLKAKRNSIRPPPSPGEWPIQPGESFSYEMNLKDDWEIPEGWEPGIYRFQICVEKFRGITGSDNVGTESTFFLSLVSDFQQFTIIK
ncbi:MAG: hypothetical protein HQM09_14655 [Candidatus Riflebacteria bacterium]|nr:hypothetical protein [Candidatus Riflebacteria bacterium]